MTAAAANEDTKLVILKLQQGERKFGSEWQKFFFI